MKKKFFYIFMLIICSLCVLAFSEQDGLYTYELNEDMTVTITGFDWSNNHGDIYIPEMLGNRMVTAIGERAFAKPGNVAVSITLPEGIRSIGELAFQGVAIKYINIPQNVTEIGGGAFSRCSVMQFRVAEGHQVFATIDNALYNKQTKTLIAWPENKEIGPIPNGIKAIGDYVFYGRKINDQEMESHLIPDSVTTIGRFAFFNSTFSGWLNNVKEIGDYAFSRGALKGGYVAYDNDVDIRDEQLTLTRIGSHAFENSVVHFGADTNRNHLSGFILNTTPYVIEDYAFHNSAIFAYTNNATINLENVTSIGDYAFEDNKEGSVNGYAIGFVQGDFDSLKYIGQNAFFNHEMVGVVELSDISVVPVSAFEVTTNRPKLSGVILGQSVTSIEEKAFHGQSEITEVILNDGLLSIGSEAFMNCQSLTEVCIPASVTYIGEKVFSRCSDKLIIVVEAGSYGEIWARTCGYSYRVNGKVEDTSWLDD